MWMINIKFSMIVRTLNENKLKNQEAMHIKIQLYDGYLFFFHLKCIHLLRVYVGQICGGQKTTRGSWSFLFLCVFQGPNSGHET